MLQECAKFVSGPHVLLPVRWLRPGNMAAGIRSGTGEWNSLHRRLDRQSNGRCRDGPASCPHETGNSEVPDFVADSSGRRPRFLRSPGESAVRERLSSAAESQPLLMSPMRNTCSVLCVASSRERQNLQRLTRTRARDHSCDTGTRIVRSAFPPYRRSKSREPYRFAAESPRGGRGLCRRCAW